VVKRVMLWSGWALIVIGIAVAIVSLAQPGHAAAGQGLAGSSTNETYGKLVDVGWVISAAGAVVLVASQLRRFSPLPGPPERSVRSEGSERSGRSGRSGRSDRSDSNHS
jgi:hypothetical protein